MSPLEKWGAGRKGLNLPGAGGTWLVLLIVAGAVMFIAAVLAFILYSRYEQRSKTMATFASQAGQLGLTGDERDLLARIAELAGLKSPAAIFTMERSFHLGAGRLVSKERTAAMDEEERARCLSVLGSLSGKLVFHGEAAPRLKHLKSTRQIAEGTMVYIVSGTGTDVIKAAVSGNTPAGLVIEPHKPISAKGGKIGVARFPDGGRVWEFNATVIENAGGTTLLGHTEHLRASNRRRFPRIPVSKPARMTLFPFVREGSEGESLALEAAQLMEMAGPGLKITAPLPVAIGDKVLVVMTLGGGKAIEGVGKVRRLFAKQGGQSVFAVELIGLSSEEIAELARETNAAALENAQRDSLVGAPKEGQVHLLARQGSSK